MKRLCFSILGVAGLILSASTGTALATSPIDSASAAKASPAAAPGGGLTTICHATLTRTHPYFEITVSGATLEAHEAHRDRQDIIPAPGRGCPADLVFPEEPTPEPGTFSPCVVGPGVTQTRTTVTGTNANDTIDCTNARPGKWVLGLNGNDTITGTAFNDTIDGGNGRDTLTGGIGKDYLEGNIGNDTMTGSSNADALVAGGGNDTMSGGVGNDSLLARPSDGDAGPGTGADTLNGDAQLDTCSAVAADGDTRTGCEM